MKRSAFSFRHIVRGSLVSALAFAILSSSLAAPASAASNNSRWWPRHPVPKGTPTVTGAPATSVTAGSAYSFKPTASDPNGRTLRFSISNKPSWASFSNSNGALTGTPAAANVGTFANIVISASDGLATGSLPAFSIKVAASSTPTPANRPPVITGTPPASVAAGSAYSFTPAASDPDGNPLSFSVANKPVWASFSISTGSLTGTPTSAQLGSYNNVTISVSDGKVSTALPLFNILVTGAANTAPVISGTPATSVTAGSAYSFKPSASDANGDALTFSIQNKPTWASFSTTSGALTGTPAASNVGTSSNIVISVSDGNTSTSLPAFSIAVAAGAASGPPPATGTATINWTPPTTNTDGSALTDLAGFTIYYGTSASNLNQSVKVAGAGLRTSTISSLASGTWFFSVQSYTNTGLQSAVTATVSKTIP